MIGAAMRIVKVGVLAPTNNGIPLGVQGENRATQVEFDTRPWFREYQSGTVSAVARRDGDPATYPLTLDVADGTAVWQVSDTDTAKAGEGAVELTMTSAGVRVRSLTFKTLVTASLTDSPVDDDAWYGWLDKAVVKVDETVQSAQRKMGEVDEEWTSLKADVTAKVEECGDAAAQAASDAHHAKVDAQATAKALESAEGSVAKAEAAASRAVDAALAADDSAVEASRSAQSAGESAESAAGSATSAATSASEAATSASSAADAASAASGSASAAEQSATDASNAKVAAQTAKAEAATSAGNAATSASNAAESATAAAQSASDADASVNAINVISPKTVDVAPTAEGYKSVAIGDEVVASGQGSVALGYKATSVGFESIAIGDSANAQESFAVALGELSDARAGGSVAVGYNSVAYTVNEFSVGNNNYTREITHVSTPTAPTSASTKKYTDDNDTKTLREAKKYTDANTSNALVGNVSGKLLHVEDAWPGKPLGLTIDGSYKQDGTPSPDNPVSITVVENPVLKVTGSNVLMLNPALEKVTSNGITFTPMSDGGIRIEGTSTGVAFYNLDFSNTFKRSIEPFIGRKIFWNTPYMIVGCELISGEQGGFGSTGRVPADSRFWRSYLYIRDIGKMYDEVVYPAAYVNAVGTYAPYTSASLPITLPAEHPYLAALPDGTHDEIVIDNDGNVSLVARVGKSSNAKCIQASNKLNQQGQDGTLNALLAIELTPPMLSGQVLSGTSTRFKNGFTTKNADTVRFGAGTEFVYLYTSNESLINYNTTTDTVNAWFAEHPTEFIYVLATPITYQLGKLDVPSLPETISNAWTDAELTTNMNMTYKRDINIAFDNLAQAVVAASAGE